MDAFIGRSRSLVLALLVLAGLVGVSLTAVLAPAPAHAEVTGTGGQYITASAHILGTSSKIPANTWRTVQVAGVGGLPTSGIGAVSLTTTVPSSTTTAQLSGRPNASTASTLMMIYATGQNSSNTSTRAVGADGTIQVQMQSAENLILDVTGYYTSTDAGIAAGGFQPVPGATIADTRNGNGVRQGTVGSGGSVTFQVSGVAGVPTGASAVVANYTVFNRSTTSGYIAPSAAGSSNGSGLNYPGAVSATAMNAQVPLSSDGKITVANATGGGTVDIVVDIQGYFIPSNPGGGYTPETGRIIDTRTTKQTLSVNQTLAVQIGSARSGVPSVEQGLSAVALTITTVHPGTDDGWSRVWANGATEPNLVNLNYAGNTIRSNTIIVPVGADGKIVLKNGNGSATDYVVDLQGVYNSLPSGPEVLGLTGSRPSATNLSFGITDQTSAQVDVATGNLMISTTALTLPGVNASTPIGVSYNSRSQNVSDSTSSDANRWQYSLAAAGNLTTNSKGVVYTAADGGTWQFTPTGAQGAFTSPTGLLQLLTRTSSDYTLKDLTSNQTIHFNLAGQLVSIVDRNSNTIAFNYAGDKFTLANIVSTAGPFVDNADKTKVTGARVAASSYSNRVQTFTQTNGSSSRSVSWSKNSSGNITSYTDALGNSTTFGYASGTSRLTTITAPGGGVTTVTYDPGDRVTQVDQANTTAGSPGTATTRLQYTSSTQTLVAGPNTDTSVAVGTVVHTTYTVVDATHLVTSVVDAAGRMQGATYNANSAPTQTTAGAAGSSMSQTTGTYGQNGGKSLTNVQSGAGAASSATYNNATAGNAYLPDSATDANGGKSRFTYDTSGNQTSTMSGADTPSAATANVTYNTDGTVKTATAPANSGNPTTYSYIKPDGTSDKQLTSITPPTGTTLGVKNLTYDAFGRQASQTDGRGNTTSYTYDNDDRLLTTSFSDGTTTVSSVYDANGNQTSQASAPGTTTNTFDQQNRIIRTINTAGGGAVSYTYDRMGNQLTTTADGGTVTNSYDATGVLTGTQIPNASGTTLQAYKVDDHGRRTDTWLGANALVTGTTPPTAYRAHTITSYDTSSRVNRIQAYTGTGDSSNTLVFDTSYCYYANSTPGSCPTDTTSAATMANDRTQLQWAKNNLTGQSTAYTYIGTRLQSAAQSGGTSNTSWTYAYDNNGNRTGTQTSVNGGAPTVQSLTFNAASQITTAGYTYDGAGNLTASPGATYTYNGAEQMTSSTTNGVTTRYTYAGADQNQVLSETTPGTDSYTYAYGGRGELLIQGTGGATYDIVNDASTGQAIDLVNPSVHSGMYLYDGIGNPVGILTDTGTRAYDVSFDPYGTQTINAGGSSDWYGNTPYGFKAGTRTDGDALVKFGLRWYLPTTGTWTQRDTLDAPLDPSNANRYAYAGDDPVNGSDPSGRAYCSSSVGCYTGTDGQPHTGTGLQPTPAEAAAERSCFIDYFFLVTGGIGIRVPTKAVSRYLFLGYTGFQGFRSLSSCYSLGYKG